MDEEEEENDVLLVDSKNLNSITMAQTSQSCSFSLNNSSPSSTTRVTNTTGITKQPMIHVVTLPPERRTVMSQMSNDNASSSLPVISNNLDVVKPSTAPLPQLHTKVLVTAQVMRRDDSSGGWLPVNGGGLSRVGLYQQQRIEKQQENNSPTTEKKDGVTDKNQIKQEEYCSNNVEKNSCKIAKTIGNISKPQPTSPHKSCVSSPCCPEISFQNAQKATNNSDTMDNRSPINDSTITTNNDSISANNLTTITPAIYRILGRRLIDNASTLDCMVDPKLQYYRINPTFHHWKTGGNAKYGLTFASPSQAATFDNSLQRVITVLRKNSCDHLVGDVNATSSKSSNKEDILLQTHTSGQNYPRIASDPNLNTVKSNTPSLATYSNQRPSEHLCPNLFLLPQYATKHNSKSHETPLDDVNISLEKAKIDRQSQYNEFSAKSHPQISTKDHSPYHSVLLQREILATKASPHPYRDDVDNLRPPFSQNYHHAQTHHDTTLSSTLPPQPPSPVLSYRSKNLQPPTPPSFGDHMKISGAISCAVSASSRQPSSVTPPSNYSSYYYNNNVLLNDATHRSSTALLHRIQPAANDFPGDDAVQRRSKLGNFFVCCCAGKPIKNSTTTTHHHRSSSLGAESYLSTSMYSANMGAATPTPLTAAKNSCSSCATSRLIVDPYTPPPSKAHRFHTKQQHRSEHHSKIFYSSKGKPGQYPSKTSSPNTFFNTVLSFLQSPFTASASGTNTAMKDQFSVIVPPLPKRSHSLSKCAGSASRKSMLTSYTSKTKYDRFIETYTCVPYARCLLYALNIDTTDDQPHQTPSTNTASTKHRSRLHHYRQHKKRFLRLKLAKSIVKNEGDLSTNAVTHNHDPSLNMAPSHRYKAATGRLKNPCDCSCYTLSHSYSSSSSLSLSSSFSPAHSENDDNNDTVDDDPMNPEIIIHGVPAFRQQTLRLNEPVVIVQPGAAAELPIDDHRKAHLESKQLKKGCHTRLKSDQQEAHDQNIGFEPGLTTKKGGGHKPSDRRHFKPLNCLARWCVLGILALVCPCFCCYPCLRATSKSRSSAQGCDTRSTQTISEPSKCRCCKSTTYYRDPR